MWRAQKAYARGRAGQVLPGIGRGLETRQGDAGRTTDEGRECLVVAIADEETIGNLESYKGYLARLADPRGLSAEEAKRIIGLAKPVYMLMAGCTAPRPARRRC